MGDHNVQAMVMVAWQEGIHHVLVPHVAHQQAHQQAHHQGHQLATGAVQTQAIQPYQSTHQSEAQEQDLEGSAVQAQVLNGAEEEDNCQLLVNKSASLVSSTNPSPDT